MLNLLLTVLVDVGVRSWHFRHVPSKGHSKEVSYILDRGLYLLESQVKAEGQEGLEDVLIVEINLFLVTEALLLSYLGILEGQLSGFQGWNWRLVFEL